MTHYKHVVGQKEKNIMKQYATYLRVSTQKQGASGLGLESQRKMCEDFIRQNDGELLQEFIDVESGTHRNRKGLQDAISFCKSNQCPLVIAKLDRLARDVEFCFKVINTGIEIHFTDMPQINTLLLGVFASVAQYERELTSDRTKKALAAKKARGEKVGAQAEKWKESYKNKSQEAKDKESMKRGATKNKRFVESRDIVVMQKILHKVFPEPTANEDMYCWDWAKINVAYDNRINMLSAMRDYKEIDHNLFAKWDFSDIESKAMLHKLASFLQSIRRSANRNHVHTGNKESETTNI